MMGVPEYPMTQFCNIISLILLKSGGPFHNSSRRRCPNYSPYGFPNLYRRPNPNLYRVNQP